jgi:hypothetical protein
VALTCRARTASRSDEAKFSFRLNRAK